MSGLPRALGHLDGDGERVVPLGGLVRIREVVHHFLEADGVRRRELTHRQVLADDRIAGRVDVDTEGGEGVDPLNLGERVLDQLQVSVARPAFDVVRLALAALLVGGIPARLRVLFRFLLAAWGRFPWRQHRQGSRRWGVAGW